MSRPRTLLALLVTQTLALGAHAQSEYGRASGGSIDAIVKSPRQVSGSLSLSQSTGGRGYDGSLGAELLDDRLWFFGAAAVLPRMRFSTGELTAFDAKATAQAVDWNTVTASFSQLRQPGFSGSLAPLDVSAPTSFLSLRSTSLLTERTMLSFSFSRSSGERNAFPVTGVSTDR